jgi:hypothetical protein
VFANLRMGNRAQDDEHKKQSSNGRRQRASRNLEQSPVCYDWRETLLL